MKMKKVIAAFSVFALMMVGVPMVTAYAHGGHGRNMEAVNHALCTVEECHIVGNHIHDDVTYGGHYIGDGHEYHQLCDMKECSELAHHEHDGVTCLPHSNEDGYSYHNRGHGRKGCHS